MSDISGTAGKALGNTYVKARERYLRLLKLQTQGRMIRQEVLHQAYARMQDAYARMRDAGATDPRGNRTPRQRASEKASSRRSPWRPAGSGESWFNAM